MNLKLKHNFSPAKCVDCLLKDPYSPEETTIATKTEIG